MAVNFWHWQKYLNGDFGCDFVWNDFSQYKKRHLVQFSRKVACSRRSDSGERCEVKKAMKSFACTPFYFALLPTIGAPEQAIRKRETAVGWLPWEALGTTQQRFVKASSGRFRGPSYQ